MIKFNTTIFIILILVISSCSNLDSLQQSYKNFLLPSPDRTYIVQPGDSVWSIAFNFNLDAEQLIKNNNLKMPYTIYPNQKLLVSDVLTKKDFIKKSKVNEWHHPLGNKSKTGLKDGTWLIFRESRGISIHSISGGKVVVSGPDIPGYGNLVMIPAP
jgi:LysM repeat protein